MARYDSKKISEVIDDIEDGRMLLPALQRNFVWSENKICDLFESLMHDYPIGTFLFWELKQEKMQDYVFNGFISSFDERKGKNNQRGERVTVFNKEKYIGILDGQQRITSIYLGVKGSFQTKIAGRKKTDPNAYEDRFLCLNILHNPEVRQDTDNVFSFMVNSDTKRLVVSDDGTRYFWWPVKDIFEKGSGTTVSKIVREIESTYFPSGWPISEREWAEENIENLRFLLFTRENVNYYTSADQDLDSVVDIFVRVNSGGENLQASDLILSVSALHAPNEDMHVLLVDTADDINDMLGNVQYADNNFMLRAGLMFTGAESVSLNASDSYSIPRTKKIYENWDAIAQALKYAIRFLNKSGINVAKISKNIFLSVAYYFYRKPSFAKPGTETSSKPKYVKDRILIRQYVLRGIFAGIFDSSTGAVLLSVRKIMDKAINANKDYFPLDDLMAELGDKKLSVTADVVDRIMQLTYGDPKVEPLLRELRADRSVSSVQIDHIWAKTYMESKSKCKAVFPSVTDELYKQYRDARHNLANLELLSDGDNESKGDTLFDIWLADTNQDDQFMKQNCIPRKEDGTLYSFEEFFDFMGKREELLKVAIRDALPEDYNAIVAKYNF